MFSVSNMKDATIEELDFIDNNIDNIFNNTGLTFIDLMENINDNPNLNLYNLIKEGNNEQKKRRSRNASI